MPAQGLERAQEDMPSIKTETASFSFSFSGPGAAAVSAVASVAVLYGDGDSSICSTVVLLDCFKFSTVAAIVIINN